MNFFYFYSENLDVNELNVDGAQAPYFPGLIANPPAHIQQLLQPLVQLSVQPLLMEENVTESLEGNLTAESFTRAYISQVLDSTNNFWDSVNEVFNDL